MVGFKLPHATNSMPKHTTHSILHPTFRITRTVSQSGMLRIGHRYRVFLGIPCILPCYNFSAWSKINQEALKKNPAEPLACGHNCNGPAVSEVTPWWPYKSSATQEIEHWLVSGPRAACISGPKKEIRTSDGSLLCIWASGSTPDTSEPG